MSEIYMPYILGLNDAERKRYEELMTLGLENLPQEIVNFINEAKQNSVYFCDFEATQVATWVKINFETNH